jgi:hypothetical protein
MMPSRRQFVAAATAVTALGTTVRYRASARPKQATVRTRKDASSLGATSPEIKSFRTAVELMKAAKLPDGSAMGANDGRRWEKQAEIHGTPEEFTHCQHGNWFFLPWHRIYLYQFEEIVRQLSGDESFALPYWDWSRNRSLPATFWGTGNALDCPQRDGVNDSGRQPGRVPPMDATTTIGDSDFNRVFSPTRISAIIDEPDFETFGGTQVMMPGDSGSQGTLEGGPHNRAHTWVGLRPMPAGQFPDRAGDMALGSSPTDPIFWLHHCNIDRIWYRWTRRHTSGHPASNAWRTTSFADFYGRDGIAVPDASRITVEKTLDTTNLGYKYEDEVIPVAATGTRMMLATRLGVTANESAGGIGSFRLKTDDAFVAGVNKMVDNPLDKNARQTVRLVLSGITPPKRLDTYYDVYLNCKKLTKDTPIIDPSYVGSCTFFHGPKGHGHDAGKGQSFSFSLGRKFSQLYGDKKLDKNEPLQIGVVARVPADNETGPAQSIEIIPISPENVRIDVLREAV